jgi:anaerobic dimethyl sulfoxide reductase subunit C (anchor subunit)
MLGNEWSLVLFTILVQTAAGLVVVSETARRAGDVHSPRQLSWQIPGACALAALGLLVSLTHLGSPQNSVLAVANLGDSWLSREILATSVFFLASLALATVRWKRPERSASGLGILAACLGLADVFVMSRVYQLPAVPVWNTVATTLGFFGTMFLTGTLAAGVLFSIQSRQAQQGDPQAAQQRTRLVGVLFVAAVLGLALKLIGLPLDMIALSAADNLGTSGVSLLASAGTGLLVMRLLLVLAGAAIFAWVAMRILAGRSAALVQASLVALCLVLAGELLGRFLFYGSYIRIGL